MNTPSTLTTDFSGTYDYPAAEAKAVAESFKEYFDGSYTADEINQRIVKERLHWLKVFGTDAQGIADMARFSEVFNAAIFPLSNFAI